MAVHTTALTQSAPTTTGTLKRDVHDTIRHLFPRNRVQSLVSPGSASGVKDGIRRSPGLIGKRRVESAKYEAFYYSPMAVEFMVSTGGTNQGTLSSVDGLVATYTLINSRTYQVYRVSAVNTSTKVVTLVRIGSTDDATTTAGDKLLLLASAYPENSSSPYILSSDPTNLYNHTQIARYPIAISATAKGAPHFGGDFWKRLKNETVSEALRKIDNSLIFSERAAGTNETTTDSTLGDVVRTMRGLWNWEQYTMDMGYSMTPEKLIHDLPVDYMHDSVAYEEKKVLLIGTRSTGIINEWAREDLVHDQPGDGEYKIYGVNVREVMTDIGPIMLFQHDAFNRGDFAKCGLLFCPERVDYIHLRDRDIKPWNGIEGTSTDGYEDDLYGEISICPNDGGYSITKITNMW